MRAVKHLQETTGEMIHQCLCYGRSLESLHLKYLNDKWAAHFQVYPTVHLSSHTVSGVSFLVWFTSQGRYRHDHLSSLGDMPHLYIQCNLMSTFNANVYSRCFTNVAIHSPIFKVLRGDNLFSAGRL